MAGKFYVNHYEQNKRTAQAHNISNQWGQYQNNKEESAQFNSIEKEYRFKNILGQTRKNTNWMLYTRKNERNNKGKK